MTTGGPFVTRPVLGDAGTLYAGSWDGKLYAISRAGEILWTYQTGARIDAPPAAGPFRIVVTSWDGAAHAVDPSGALIWRFRTGAPIDVSATFGPASSVYVVADDGMLYAVDDETGDERWRADLGSPPTTPVTLAADTLFVGTADGRLHRLDTMGAALSPPTVLGDGQYAVDALVPGDGVVYAGLNLGDLAAVAHDGTLTWQQNISYASVLAPAVAPDGTIYVGSNNKNLYRFRPDGEEIWHEPTDYAVLGAPTITDDGVYVSANAILRFDSSGNVTRVSELPAEGTPLVGQDGWLYFNTVDARIYGLPPGEPGPEPAITPATEIVDDLEFPVSLVVAPDGTMLVTEKQGAVRIVRDGKLQADPVATFSPHTPNEAGLIGLELAPDFADSGIFFVSYTPAADLDHLRVARLRLTGDTAEILDDPWLELPSLRTTNRHYGGNLKFGPYGKLYVSLGELHVPEQAADPSKLPGSLLRYEADLSIPGDNPIPGSPVYAFGFRNPYDFDITPDGTIYVGDNGPDVADEVNRVLPGRDYGWPGTLGFCDHAPEREPCEVPVGEPPVYELRHVIAPTAVLVYDGDSIPELKGDVLVGGWHSRKVHRFRSVGGGPLVELPPLYHFTGGTPGYYGGGVVDLAVDVDGAVLVMVSGTTVGSIFRIAPG